jgi:hypothetical protein
MTIRGYRASREQRSWSERDARHGRERERLLLCRPLDKFIFETSLGSDQRDDGGIRGRLRRPSAAMSANVIAISAVCEPGLSQHTGSTHTRDARGGPPSSPPCLSGSLAQVPA